MTPGEVATQEQIDRAIRLARRAAALDALMADVAWALATLRAAGSDESDILVSRLSLALSAAESAR